MALSSSWREGFVVSGGTMALGLGECAGKVNFGLGRKRYDTRTARKLYRRAQRVALKREDIKLVGTDAEFIKRPRRYLGWWL